uniref:Uncharacterized protein n=1 Tax=Arundo donax TaxID=35708 RepID=A0A0A9GVK4_ARUDO
MEIQVEKIVMHPLKLSTNLEARSSFSCFQPGQVALVSTWPPLMLWFSMTVIGMPLYYGEIIYISLLILKDHCIGASNVPSGIHKLIYKLKTVHIG